MGTCIRHSCDRCGKVVLSDQITLPEGWYSVDFSNDDTTHHLHSCDECKDRVFELITKNFLHIGYAKQSGSGKTWTELPIDKKDDKDRWFPVYAFKEG